MLGLFKYLTRDIKHAPCVAHILHLIICNGLDTWKDTKCDLNKNCDNSINSTNGDDSYQGLNLYIRTLNIDNDPYKSFQKNNQRGASQDAFNDDVSLLLLGKILDPDKYFSH